MVAISDSNFSRVNSGRVKAGSKRRPVPVGTAGAMSFKAWSLAGSTGSPAQTPVAAARSKKRIRLPTVFRCSVFSDGTSALNQIGPRRKEQDLDPAAHNFLTLP